MRVTGVHCFRIWGFCYRASIHLKFNSKFHELLYVFWRKMRDFVMDFFFRSFRFYFQIEMDHVKWKNAKVE